MKPANTQTVLVTLQLTRRQYRMLRKVARADRFTLVEDAILEDLKEHVASSYHVFSLSEEQTRARWQGKR